MSSERLQTHLDRMIFAGEKAVKYVRGMDGDGFRENEIIQMRSLPTSWQSANARQR